MTYDEILDRLAPCGLSCEKCFAHEQGAIRAAAGELQQRLGNFDIYAQRFRTLVGDPVFDRYPQFKEMLSYFARGTCGGCRKEQCRLFTTCGVRPCHQERELDYCFLCDGFPCDRTNFDKHLYERWVALNQRIREIGIEAYYEETRDDPRYR